MDETASSIAFIHLGEMVTAVVGLTWEQAELTRLGDRLGPAADVKLAVDGPHLTRGSVDRDVKFLADL
jgi:hypothetical protein